MNHTSIDFTSFTQTILNNLREKLGPDYTVFSHSVKKNNGIERTGIVVKRKDQSASPTIYINQYYRKEIAIEEMERIADILYHEFQAAELEEEIDLSDFLVFEKAKHKVCFKLIHAEKNRELLAAVPHRLFHNLAVVFYYLVQEAPFFGEATILIRNSHMHKWGITTDELMQIARQNTPALLPAVIDDMVDVISELLAEGGNDAFGGEEEIGKLLKQAKCEGEFSAIPMYVLTNRQKLYGAACMLYPDVLKHFGEKIKQDFYILPSSVHEVILVPGDAQMDESALCDIVTDINRTQVSAGEVLADSVYFYKRKSDEILWIS